MLRLILLLMFLLFSSAGVAQTKPPLIRFEPIFGFEHTQLRYPEPARYVTRALYGARVLAGPQYLALEAEVTQAKSRRDYPSEDQKVEDESTRGMFGARSTFALSSFLGAFVRLGMRASQDKTIITDTTTQEKETKDPGIQWDPYAGAGLQLALSSYFALNAGVTIIFTEGFPQTKEYDSQYSFGFTVKFGSFM